MSNCDALGTAAALAEEAVGLAGDVVALTGVFVNPPIEGTPSEPNCDAVVTSMDDPESKSMAATASEFKKTADCLNDLAETIVNAYATLYANEPGRLFPENLCFDDDGNVVDPAQMLNKCIERINHISELMADKKPTSRGLQDCRKRNR